jgi:hypothetical protein
MPAYFEKRLPGLFLKMTFHCFKDKSLEKSQVERIQPLASTLTICDARQVQRQNPAVKTNEGSCAKVVPDHRIHRYGRALMQLILTLTMLLLLCLPVEAQSGPVIKCFDGELLTSKQAAQLNSAAASQVKAKQKPFWLCSQGKLYELDDVGCSTAEKLLNAATDKVNKPKVFLDAVIHDNELWVLAIKDKTTNKLYESPNPKTGMVKNKSQ